MPNYEDVAISIESRLRSNWTTTDIVSQNVQYEFTPGRSFVYFEILNNQSFLASFGSPGNNRHRNVGMIMLHVFVPLNSGDGLALTYARQLGAIFKAKVLDSITYKAATIGNGEVADDKKNFWRRSIYIEFEFDELA